MYHLPLLPNRRAFGLGERGKWNAQPAGDSMSNVGVFGWIRDSVRRSVLLGFSDAVEQIGAESGSDDELNPQLAAVLREAAPRALAHSAESPSKPQRKRLGRSLDQLRTPSGSKSTSG